MVRTRQWALARKPRDSIVLDGPDQTFELRDIELEDIKDGELLLRPVHLSNDPAQRGWIDADIPADRLYRAPIEVGQSMAARGLAEVVETKSPKFKIGDVVIATVTWTELVVAKASECTPAADLPNGLNKTHYLGALGGTGLTAYFGLTRIGEATKDDVVVVSGAAGATGSMVVQIAKHLVGCKTVIGIAGTDNKCRWVESIGADVCLNYKDPSFAEKLKDATPEYANVYYDNVGGQILDLMFARMARKGRIVACGAISGYNTATENRDGLRNWFEVITMRLKCQGFIVTDFMSEFPQAIGALRQAVADGKIKITDEAQTVVETNFEGIPKAWTNLFVGTNQGKLVTSIKK